LTRIAVSGDDAAAFLHAQFCNDVLNQAVGESRWNGWCSPKGRLIATPVVTRQVDHYRLTVPSAQREALVRRLKMFVLRSKVRVDSLPESLYAASANAPTETTERWPDGRALNCVAGTLSEVEFNRRGIRAGTPFVLAATEDLFVPQMINFELIGGVNFRKGCYPGQEIVARTQYRGGIKRRMGRFTAPAMAAAGDPLFTPALGDQEAGRVVLLVPGDVGGSELLASAPLEAIRSGSLRLGAPDGPCLTRLPLPYPVPEVDGLDPVA
jgi:hypothetical protein